MDIIMPKTTILPPELAVKIVWARTGSFYKSKYSRYLARSTLITLKQLREQTKKDEKENTYFMKTEVCMNASLRSLYTIYNGRNLNFDEVDKMQIEYLNPMKIEKDFMGKPKDYIKTIPGISLGAFTVGSITIQWGYLLAIFGGIIGFLTNMIALYVIHYQKQKRIVKKDYMKNLYYGHYLDRVEKELHSLY
jgi:hypothetical protein